MKYVYHLGVHKTASSLLQRNLNDNLAQLRAQRVFYVNAESPDIVQRQTRLLHQARGAADTGALKKLAQINKQMAETARAAKARIVLVSDETRLGPSMNLDLAAGATNPSFYPGAETSVMHMLGGLPLRNTRLLIYARNPESYLLSLYSDAIREAQTTLDLEAFCRAVNFNSIDFDGLETRLRSLHRDLDIKTRQYERIKLGAETYLRTFLRDIGLDPKPFTLHTAPLRPQLDATQVEALLHITAGGETKRPRLLKRLRDQVLTHAPNPLAQLKLPEWVSDSMRVTAEGRASDAA
ncbi:MAG: hypothetical protein AAFW87_05720 [Pseudomonadota bacterium]